MKTTETKLIFPEFDTLAEYVRLEAINLDVGYKGEKGEKGDKGDKGDPGKDADIEGAKQAIERANGVIEALEKLELNTEQSITSFVNDKKAEIDSYLELQSLKQDQDIASSMLAANSALLAANKVVEDANASVINASNAAVNANNAAQSVLDEIAKIPPKLLDLLDTLIKAKGAVDAVNLVADSLEDEVEKVLNINITRDGSILTITDRNGESSTINVLGVDYVITDDDYISIADIAATKVDCYTTAEADKKFQLKIMGFYQDGNVTELKPNDDTPNKGMLVVATIGAELNFSDNGEVQHAININSKGAFYDGKEIAVKDDLKAKQDELEYYKEDTEEQSIVASVMHTYTDTQTGEQIDYGSGLFVAPTGATMACISINGNESLVSTTPYGVNITGSYITLGLDNSEKTLKILPEDKEMRFYDKTFFKDGELVHEVRGFQEVKHIGYYDKEEIDALLENSLASDGDIIDDLYEYNFVIGDRLFLDGYLNESKKKLYLNNPDIAAIEYNKLIIK